MGSLQPLEVPEIFNQYPRVSLLWPFNSPVQFLDRVSGTLKDSNVKIWIKRDDCNSGLGLGGNKVRALEYIFGDLLAKGCDVAVFEGVMQSNCARLVAAAGARLGIEAQLVRRPGSGSHEPTLPNYLNLGNVQVAKILSANFLEGSPEEVMSHLTKSGKKPYHIPPGASGIAVGGLGYARLAFEIIQQEQELGVFFDTIILSSASGSTAGGIAAGFRFASKVLGLDPNLTRQVTSVFVVSDPERTTRIMMKALQATTNLLNPNGPFEEQQSSGNGVNLQLAFGYNAGGHGHADDKTIAAMKLMGSLEGIVLEPAYTGKSFAYLLDKIKAKEIKSGSNVLFLHTGGVVALGAYSHLDYDQTISSSNQWT